MSVAPFCMGPCTTQLFYRLSVTTEGRVIGLIRMISADTALLLIMLLGLVLLRHNGGCTLGLTCAVWKGV